MAFTYQTCSTTESFDLQAMLGEGIAIHVYGATWNSTSWLSDPTAALSAVNDAFDSVANLSFSGIQIFSGLTYLGTGMAFAVVDPVYKGKTYLDPDDIGPLRANIASALNTGDCGLYLTYGDVVLGTSKSAS
jgi:hypothetical protein